MDLCACFTDAKDVYNRLALFRAEMHLGKAKLQRPTGSLAHSFTFDMFLLGVAAAASRHPLSANFTRRNV